jgi:hypothetical protein
MIKPLISFFFKLIQLSSCGWAGPSWPSQVIGRLGKTAGGREIYTHACYKKKLIINEDAQYLYN